MNDHNSQVCLQIKYLLQYSPKKETHFKFDLFRHLEFYWLWISNWLSHFLMCGMCVRAYIWMRVSVCHYSAITSIVVGHFIDVVASSSLGLLFASMIRCIVCGCQKSNCINFICMCGDHCVWSRRGMSNRATQTPHTDLFVFIVCRVIHARLNARECVCVCVCDVWRANQFSPICIWTSSAGMLWWCG